MMNSLEIKIPKEIIDYHETVFFGMTLRQCVCVIAGAILACVTYLLLKPMLGTEAASWLCICVAVPFGVIGFMRWHGLTAVQAARLLCLYLLTQKFLPHKPTNVNYELAQALAESERRAMKGVKKSEDSNTAESTDETAA